MPRPRGLLGDEGGLHGVRSLGRAQSFDRGNAHAGHGRHADLAGARRPVVDQHRAAAALAFAAAELGAVQPQVVAQHVQQRLRRVPRLDAVLLAVDEQVEGAH